MNLESLNRLKNHSISPAAPLPFLVQRLSVLCEVTLGRIVQQSNSIIGVDIYFLS